MTAGLHWPLCDRTLTLHICVHVFVYLSVTTDVKRVLSLMEEEPSVICIAQRLFCCSSNTEASSDPFNDV